MPQTIRKQKKDHDLKTFWLKKNLSKRLDAYCKEHHLNVSQFCRMAVLEKLDRPVTENIMLSELSQLENVMASVQKLTEDLKTREKREDELLQRIKVLEASQTPISNDLSEAIEILRREQPSNFTEASKLINDPNIMMEAITALLSTKELAVNKVRRYEWQ
ncbi:MAG: hypothetical protein ACFE9L_02680 [Candidatus Hodarchaeota archaeon]